MRTWTIILFLFLFAPLNSGTRNSLNYYVEDVLSLPLNEYSLKKVLNYYDISFQEIVLAQIKLETGNFTSRVCMKNNNLFGLYDSRESKYYQFTTWQESVKFYKIKIQSRLLEDEGYYEFLERIGYAQDINYIDKIKNMYD